MSLPDFLTQDRYGEIRLNGHRIGLYHVVYFLARGDSADAIVSRYPSLPLELVNRVIAFYGANKDEVDAYVALCQDEIDRQRETAPEGPTLAQLRQRRKAMVPESSP